MPYRHPRLCVRLFCGVLWTVRCGALTSLSPRCHPASAGLRHHWPLPKSHSATSAIHKRQPLLLSISFSHPSSPLFLLSNIFTYSCFPNWVALKLYSCANLCFTFNLNTQWFSSYLFLPCNPSLSLFALLFQWKKSFTHYVGSSCVWWQWTGNHRTFLVQEALNHQR